MRIYFIRHGESQANVLRIISNRGLAHGLTEKGRQQVEELAAELASTGLDFQIYSSPLLRAQESAQILSTSLHTGVQLSEALQEYDCGVLEGKSDTLSWEIHNRVRADWAIHRRFESRAEGGESWLDIRARFLPFLEGLLSDEKNCQANLLLVGHGGTFLSMLPLVLKNIEVDFALSSPYPNAAYVLAENTLQGLVCLEWCGQKC